MTENTTTKVIPRAIYAGFSNHDCATYYRCPLCKGIFNDWILPAGSLKIEKCPCCGSELRFY